MVITIVQGVAIFSGLPRLVMNVVQAGFGCFGFLVSLNSLHQTKSALALKIDE
jgi:hypothetical protein